MAQTFIVPNPQRYRFSAATSSNLKKPLLHGRLFTSPPAQTARLQRERMVKKARKGTLRAA
jgi:hypothetical protein